MGKLLVFCVATVFNWMAFLSLGIFLKALGLKYDACISQHVVGVLIFSGVMLLVMVIIGIILISSYAKKKAFPPNP